MASENAYGKDRGSSSTSTPSSDHKREIGSSPEPQNNSSDQLPVSSKSTVNNGNSVNSTNAYTLDCSNQNASLNLNMTAKELRAQLAARKKYDPKKDSTIDFKKKYDIVQKL